MYIHAANPENGPVRSGLLLLTIIDGKFLSLQMTSYMSFNKTENFAMTRSLVSSHCSLTCIWIYEFNKKCWIGLSQAFS